MTKWTAFLLIALSFMTCGCGKRIENGTYAFEREENGVRVVHTYRVFDNSNVTMYEAYVKGVNIEEKQMTGLFTKFDGGARGQLFGKKGETRDEELTMTDAQHIISSRFFGVNMRRWTDEDRQMEQVRGGFETGFAFLKEQMAILGWRLGDNVRVTYDISKATSELSSLEATIYLSFPGKSYTASSTYAWNGRNWSYLKGDLDRLDEAFSRALQDLPQFMTVRRR